MKIKSEPAKCVSILGTGSDVGKSIVVTALCRIFSDLGFSVSPFKAQNMSNNSYVTASGGEMGRAQVVQAQAAGIEPDVDMNPVLLKPSSNTTTQVVLHGKPIGNKNGKGYFDNTDYLFEKAKSSLEHLRSIYDFIIMEGAGSCAEVNLRNRDFVNFRMAHTANAPVILVSDIDRGGVFAQIIGTLEIIPEKDRKCVQGIIINRFRGDATLFQDGIKYIEKQTGLPVLGLVPFFNNIEIDSEDGLPLDIIVDPVTGPEKGKINIAVLRLKHISNFTDFAPLERENDAIIHYLSRPRCLEGYSAVIIPGTKNVRYDLEWLRKTGWIKTILDYVKKGGEVCGICGGFQMLGKIIKDPNGVEGKPGETMGLGLLDIETTLQSEKTLCRSSGIWNKNNEKVEGYEIHMGTTKKLSSGLSSVIRVMSRDGNITDEEDGAMTENGKIWGTYFHGLFDMPGFRRNFLKHLFPEYAPNPEREKSEGSSEFRERQYRLLAEHFYSHLDMPKLMGIVDLPVNKILPT